MFDYDYFGLNEALNDYFFDGKFRHRPVYIDLEGEAEDEIASSLAIEPDKLSNHIGRVVASTLTLGETNPYSQHMDWLSRWNERDRLEPPPFTALLCAFSIAAERMSEDENFSSNNYYDRLFDLLSVSLDAQQNKLRNNAKSTRQFWRALNIWLSEHDYELGRPTARAVNHWAYVSYCLSQALVRDADRQRFEKLFEAMSLVPGENVSTSEMMLYLNEWMLSGTGPTVWLRKLWNVSELRERVVAAAIEEFQAWEPAKKGDARGVSRTRLRWSLGFGGFPKRRAILTLVARSQDGEEEVTIENVTDKVVEEALATAGSDLSLSFTSDTDILFLGPTADIDICRLLLGSCVFKGKRTEREYRFTAKPLVALARSEDGTGYLEVQRAGLFEDICILCHDAWIQRVDAHLALTARPGFTRINSGDMAGIPEGWAIFRDVELVRTLDKVHDALQALNPIGGEAAIAATGGLRLAPGLWHPAAPPVLEATSQRPGSALEVVSERLGQDEKKLASVNAIGDSMELHVADINPRPGMNLRATVKKGRSELTETTLSFRSSIVPRPLGRNSLFYELTNAVLPWIGATAVEALTDETDGIQGGITLGEACLATTEIASFENAVFDVPEGEVETDQEISWKITNGAEEAAPKSCVVRGYHHIKYDEFKDGDDRYAAKRGRCLTCGWETISRSSEVARKNAKAMRDNAFVPKHRASRRRGSTLAGMDDNDHDGLSPSVLLDGLCYVGRGSWASFKRLAGCISEESWFASSVSADFESLGHVDFSRDPSGRPTGWQVAPPALVCQANGTAYLAGFQNNELVEELMEKLDQVGATYDALGTESGLNLHRWDRVEAGTAITALEQVLDPHGRQVHVTESLGLTIASRVEALGEALERMPTIHIEATDVVARFDPGTGRWSRTEDVRQPGAYKVQHHGTRYVYKSSDGSFRETSHFAAKTLAARDASKRLHGYDPVNATFTSALGAEPAGLYARALVASAGSLPRKENGRVLLEGVEPSVAGLVLKKLYGRS